MFCIVQNECKVNVFFLKMFIFAVEYVFNFHEGAKERRQSVCDL